MEEQPNLDALFGECLPYARTISDIEEQLVAESLQILSLDTAPALKGYLDSVMGLPLVGVLHRTTPILWLIDEEGRIRFALEEVFNLATQHLKYILPREGPDTRPGEGRLGHPGLLEPPTDGTLKSARIGGELNYNPSPRHPERPWVLTNNSGRFGKRAHIKREHLDNAASAFGELGISLRTFFIYTPDRAGDEK